MSFDYVKSIVIKNDTVYITSAANNVYPRTYEQWEPKGLSEVYRKGGYEALLPILAKEVWEGNFRLQSGSKLCKLLQEGLNKLHSDSNLRFFLDTDHAAKYMTNWALWRMEPYRNAPPNISDLEALRHDKESVLAVCSKNPEAFNYAAVEIQNDREAAKEYIKECSGMLCFHMPMQFRSDKELAMIALQNNGCVYRDLNANLRADRDVTLLAFNARFPNREFFEHIPSLIESPLRENKEFMKELIKICPSLHISSAKEFLEDREIAKLWAETSKWAISDAYYLPTEYLKDPEFKKILLGRCSDYGEKDFDRMYGYLVEKYKYCCLTPPEPPKRGLNSLIQNAENRKAPSSDQKAPEKEAER